MNVTADATTMNLTDTMKFSSDARVNQEVLSINRLMVRMNYYEPGQVTLMHMHPEEDETLHIIEGEGIVTFKNCGDLPVKVWELVINTTKLLPGPKAGWFWSVSCPRTTAAFGWKIAWTNSPSIGFLVRNLRKR
jgi:hypothetical protein